MGGSKLQMTEYRQFLAFEASYEECQSALRLSMVSRAMVRRLGYPLYARIVELSHLLFKADVELRRVGQ